MEGNHPECNGDHERCDCWECLEHEVYDGPDDYEGEDD
jgi:hypothetical protein